MHTCYYKEYSHYLNRDMEFKVYGHAGLLAITEIQFQLGHVVMIYR